MVVVLMSCATSDASREVISLRATLRALRQENSKLEERLNTLEQQAGASRALAALHGASPATEQKRPNQPDEKRGASPAGAAREDNAVPALTVVKLKPKREQASTLPTRVAVVEPDEEILSELPSTQSKAQRSTDPVDGEIAEARYNEGLDALKTGNAEGGIVKLQAFAKDFPDHARADNALYFAGMGLLAQREYLTASRAFAEAIERYPAGDVVLDARLKLADCYTKLNQSSDARLAYQTIIDTFPGTSAAREAQSRLLAFKK
jgi:tol-pal system protein YbgF